MKPVGTPRTSHKKSSMKRKQESKGRLKKKEEQKKAHLGTSPLSLSSVLLSHHPIIFIGNAFDFLGCFSIPILISILADAFA